MSKRIAFFFFILCVCFFSSCEEEIPVVSVTGVKVSPTSLTLVEGEAGDLIATVSPDNADNKTITWNSKDDSIASVSNGRVTGLKVGSTAITVTTDDGGFNATCSVTVISPTISISSISLSKTELTLIEGDSATLTVTVKPDDATDKTVRWSSSDSSVATVDDGKISAVKEGTATITAKAGDKSVSCDVTVEKKVIPIVSVELNKTELSLFVGDSETLVATVKPDDATNKSVEWMVLDPRIASVDEGKVTAIKEGTTKIYALGGIYNASCALTVYPVPSNDPIAFADERIKKHCVAAYDTNSDGEVSYHEAALATSVDGVFTSTLYTSFDEFQFFTGIKEIPDNWFKDCARLKSISFPEGLTSIGAYALSNCGALTEISLPKSIKTVKRSAFEQCPNLSNVHLKSIDTWLQLDFERYSPFNKTNVTNGIHLFVNEALVTEVKVPVYFSVARDGLFSNCIDITKVSFQGPLTSIGYDAFKNCKSLETLEFLGDVKEAADGACGGCPLIQNVFVPNLSVWFSVCVMAPFGSDTHKSTNYQSDHYLYFSGKEVRELVIPEETTVIPAFAFCNCNRIYRILMEPTTPPNLNSLSLRGLNSIVYVWPGCYSEYSNYFIKNSQSDAEYYCLRRNFGIEEGDPFYIEPQVVDLGLSVKWASFNLGAVTPEDYGYVYYWGQSDLSNPNISSIRQKYNDMYISDELWWDLPKTPNDYDPRQWAPYGKFHDIEPEDDAAFVNLGKKWRIPSKAEVDELFNNCTVTEEIINNVMCYCLTSKIDGYTDKSLLLPVGFVRERNGFMGLQARTLCSVWTSGYSFTPGKELVFGFGTYKYSSSSGYSFSVSNDSGNVLLVRSSLQMAIRPVFNE